MALRPNSQRFSLICLALGALLGAGVWYSFWNEIAHISPYEKINRPIVWASLIVLSGMFSVITLFTMTLYRLTLPYLLAGGCVSGAIWFFLPHEGPLTVAHLVLLGIPLIVGMFGGLVIRSGRLTDVTYASCPNCTDPKVADQYKGAGCSTCGGAGVVQSGTNLGVLIAVIAVSAGLCYFAWTTILQKQAG